MVTNINYVFDITLRLNSKGNDKSGGGRGVVFGIKRAGGSLSHRALNQTV